MKIEEAIELEITRGDCKNCSKRYKKEDRDHCGITEEPIGSGDEYCEPEDFKPTN